MTMVQHNIVCQMALVDRQLLETLVQAQLIPIGSIISMFRHFKQCIATPPAPNTRIVFTASTVMTRLRSNEELQETLFYLDTLGLVKGSEWGRYFMVQRNTRNQSVVTSGRLVFQIEPNGNGRISNLYQIVVNIQLFY